MQGDIFCVAGCEFIGYPPPKPVIVRKAAKPRALKDCIHELPVVYCSTKHAWFTSPIICEWFFKHFVAEVRHYQENVLSIAPEEVKALLLVNALALPNAEKIVSVDDKIRMMFLPPNTISIIQPMDLGVIVSCKRFYQRKYLEEI